MLIKPLSLSTAHPGLAARRPPALRHAAAAALHVASRRLSQLARQLAATHAQPRSGASAPVIEFHAEAGAPEGALYVDGQLVALLPGISRL
jgi:hypothetical protein